MKEKEEDRKQVVGIARVALGDKYNFRGMQEERCRQVKR